MIRCCDVLWFSRRAEQWFIASTDDLQLMIKRLDFFEKGLVVIISSQVFERHETDLIRRAHGSFASMLLHGLLLRGVSLRTLRIVFTKVNLQN